MESPEPVPSEAKAEESAQEAKSASNEPGLLIPQIGI